MRGLRYFLVVLVAIAGLSMAVRLVYSRNPSMMPVFDSALAAPPAPVETQPAPKEAAPTPAPARQDSNASSPAVRPTTTSRSTSPSPVRPRQAPRRTSPAPQPNAEPVQAAPATVQEPAPPAPMPAAATPVEPAPAPWQATPRQLVRDSAYVMTNAGRLQAAIAVLDGWVRNHPTDTAVALDLARLRARAGDWQGAIAQYSALIDQQRTAPLLFERGQTYLWSGDVRRGEADLLASESMSPSAATQRQLGDHYRWQGDYARAGRWYRLASRTAPGDTSLANSMQLLDRALDARLLMPGELSGGDLGSGVQVITDNEGFDLYSLRVAQAFRLPVGTATALTVSGELRSASRATLGIGDTKLGAKGADVSVASRFGASKVSVSVGALDNDDLSSSIVRGAFSVDGFFGNARLKAAVRRAPAYETLWAPRMIGVTGSPSTTTSSQANVALPFGSSAELYAMGEFLSVSDDNSRTAFQVALRRRLPSSFSLLYAGSMMAYDRQTALYYSPARYLSQSLGIEFARYREQGLSFALRAMPGYAWMREPAGTSDSTTHDLSAFQFTTGLELGYRRGAWDLLLSSGLSSGREGGYQSQNALLYLRRSW